MGNARRANKNEITITNFMLQLELVPVDRYGRFDIGISNKGVQTSIVFCRIDPTKMKLRTQKDQCRLNGIL
jgi:hypothetical protein